MTWTNRFRLVGSLMLTFVVIFALVVIFNQRQHTIQSTSATIVAPRAEVASNYGGIVTRSFVTIGQEVAVGDPLFDVSSVSLQQDLANGVLVGSSEALQIDAAAGVLRYLATTPGTITEVRAEVGSYLSATQPLAVITGNAGRVVEAQFTLSSREYGLIVKGAPVTVRLPDDTAVAGEVDSVLVDTVDGRAVVTMRITGEQLNSRDLNLVATDGAPVQAVVQLRDEGVLAGPTDSLRELFRKVGL